MSVDVEIYRPPFSSIVSDEEVKQFDAAMSELIAGRPGMKVAIDFSQTYHISSRAIGLMVAFRKKVLATKGNIILFGANPAVARVFEVTKINNIFMIVADETAALNSLRSDARIGQNGH